MNRSFYFAFFSIALPFGASSALAQLPAPSAPALIGARSLAISPDGKRLAFSYQGDIWVVASEGGRATPVTNNIEMDDLPIWSPDGKYIAFASNRSGNNDIYVVPADGGLTKRLTWHTGGETPSDWSADGKRILFSARRDTANYTGIYALDVATGRESRILLDNVAVGSPHYNADSTRVVYTRLGFPWVRPRYEGSAASQLWSIDIATGKRVSLRNNSFQHLWPTVGLKDRLLFVSVSDKTPSSSSVNKSLGKFVDSPARTPNVYDLSGKRITSFVGAGTRFLTAARSASTYAFEQDGDVYVGGSSGEPKRISITASIDDKVTQEERRVLNGEASDAVLSPKGDKFAFVVRGEIWSIPTKKGKGPNADDATQLTDWAGTDEQPLWAPDNKTLFFVSDRNGPNRLFKLDSETLAVSPVSKGEDVTGLQILPDKLTLSYWESGVEGGLFTVSIAGGEQKRILAKGSTIGNRDDQDLAYDWSPDGRYFAYSDTLTRSGYYYWESGSNVLILDTQTGKTVNVTQLNAQHALPRFTADGKYLLLSSNRQGPGIYVIPLKPEDGTPAELELKFEKPKGPVKVEIDFDGIEDRIRKIVNQSPSGNLISDETTGEIIFGSEGDIWRASYSGEDAKRLTSGGGFSSFAMSDDKTLLTFVRNGLPGTLALRAPNNAVASFAFRADWTRDLRKERQAAFDQFWRSYNRSFYDANFHGRDWAALKERYEKFLPSVGHRNEMATVLNMMVGELESSHSEVSPAAGNPRGQTSAHPGFAWDYEFAGPGLKITEVPAKAPGSYAKTKLTAGEVVLKINGKSVQADEALYRDVLNDQVGRDLKLTVQGADGKTREVKYRALSAGEYSNLVFQNLLVKRRKFVEQESGGKITYVHIAGMDPGSLDRLNQQLWQYAQDKKAVIIDVRGNGGGNTSDRIIDILERRPNAYYQLRSQKPILGPGQTLDVPLVVMHAESSFSNAEMFPAAMKARGLATLVGMPTPGYVIYTYGLPLIDGTVGRMPSTGAFRLDGSNLENNGQQPDVRVDITPEQVFRGEDPQLSAAIATLLKKIK